MIRLKNLIMEYIGAGWSSCKAWNSKGTSYWDGSNGRPKIEFETGPAMFYIHYTGPAGGHTIASAKSGARDTMHQVFNIMVCECNKYLASTGKLKPSLEDIEVKCTVNKGIYDMYIIIYLEDVESGTYQINRRGSMNNGDPGEKSVLSAIGNVKNLEGPKRIVVSATGVTIIEYFVTYDIS